MSTQTSPVSESHNNLLSQVDSVNLWWPEQHQTVIAGVNFHEVHSRLNALRASLQEHFSVEEEGGLLPKDYDGDTRFVTQSERLLQQHAGLLRHLDSVIQRLPDTDASLAQWILARKDFNKCCDELRAHEQAEIDLLIDAFADVSGTVD